jgi:hypothetical protein
MQGSDASCLLNTFIHAHALPTADVRFLCSIALQVVEKTTRNALDVLDWIGLKHVGKTSLRLRQLLATTQPQVF